MRTKVEDLDRLLIASSAVIPLFGFPTWGYNYLHEVLLYPAAFDRDFLYGKSERSDLRHGGQRT